MQTSHILLIDSDPSGHRLFVDGRESGRFATLCAAEENAARIAGRFVPAASPRFELDFKWTLSDIEIRVATLPCRTESISDPKGKSPCVENLAV